jgi:hypothetical protein
LGRSATEKKLLLIRRGSEVAAELCPSCPGYGPGVDPFEYVTRLTLRFHKKRIISRVFERLVPFQKRFCFINLPSNLDQVTTLLTCSREPPGSNLGLEDCLEVFSWSALVPPGIYKCRGVLGQVVRPPPGGGDQEAAI